MSEAMKAPAQWMKEAAKKIADFQRMGEERGLELREHIIARMILEHSEAASPTKEEAEIAVDKMFDVWLQRRHSFYANKNLRVSGWREIAISLYRKVAASP